MASPASPSPISPRGFVWRSHVETRRRTPRGGTAKVLGGGSSTPQHGLLEPASWAGVGPLGQEMPPPPLLGAYGGGPQGPPTGAGESTEAIPPPRSFDMVAQGSQRDWALASLPPWLTPGLPKRPRILAHGFPLPARPTAEAPGNAGGGSGRLSSWLVAPLLTLGQADWSGEWDSRMCCGLKGLG